MKFFIDTEFIERGSGYPVELISIGIVAEDDREFYSVSSGFNPDHASQWVRDNVLVHIPRNVRMLSDDDLRSDLRRFCGKNPEFWGYYADYDWVALCQIFGTMMDLPSGWPMFCMDVKQLAMDLGNPELPRYPGRIEHNALDDARETKYRYEWLMKNHAGKSREYSFLNSLSDEELSTLIRIVKRRESQI